MGNIKLFEQRLVRSIWVESEQKWYFSDVDVIAVLTESDKPRDYWYRIKEREKITGLEVSTFCRHFKLEAPDGKLRETDCASTEGILRIIQSIPSQKAEPFKKWLAQVGSERLDEIENPELASKRIRETYKAKGYTEEWIEKRMRGIAIKDELTNEWKKRGVKEQTEYAILTTEISKATFGMTPTEYKTYKDLKKPTENLRDHMSDLELIFTMLGEASTTEIAKNKDAKGFCQNKKAAKDGGKIAGNARKELEKKSGKKVINKNNFKKLAEKPKKKIQRNKE